MIGAQRKVCTSNVERGNRRRPNGLIARLAH
jgi:hypothetical protein